AASSPHRIAPACSAAEARSGPARTAFDASGPLHTERTAAIDRHRLLESGASGDAHFTSDGAHPFVGRGGASSTARAPEAARMPRMVPQGAYAGYASSVTFCEELLHGTYLVAEAVFARAIESSPRLSSGSCPAAADA